MSTVPIFAPDGTLGDIPQDQLAAAVKAGAKPGVHVTGPDGSPGVIPADRTQDAVKAGAKLQPIEQQPAKSFWSDAGSALWGDLKGIEAGSAKLGLHIMEAGSGENPGPLTEDLTGQGSQVKQNWQQRTAAGEGLPYKVGAAANEALGVNVRSEEEAAAQGSPGGVVGHAAAVPVAAVATYGLARGASAINDALPSTQRAGAALQDIKTTAGDLPIDTAKVGNAALELYTQSQRGATLPPAVNKLIRRLTQPDSPPMTYAEAKDFQSNISNLSANEKMNLKPNQVRLLGQLNMELKGSLADAADIVGKGEQFTSAMKEYHQAMKLKGWSEDAISAGWKVALGALGVHELTQIMGRLTAR